MWQRFPDVRLNGILRYWRHEGGRCRAGKELCLVPALVATPLGQNFSISVGPWLAVLVLCKEWGLVAGAMQEMCPPCDDRDSLCVC